eukprot:scaffold202323_cov25-Tisochrysis_lutea.AAC.1
MSILGENRSPFRPRPAGGVITEIYRRIGYMVPRIQAGAEIHTQHTTGGWLLTELCSDLVFFERKNKIRCGA